MALIFSYNSRILALFITKYQTTVYWDIENEFMAFLFSKKVSFAVIVVAPCDQALYQLLYMSLDRHGGELQSHWCTELQNNGNSNLEIEQLGVCGTKSSSLMHRFDFNPS